MQTPMCWHWGLYFWDKNTSFNNNFLPSKSLICPQHSQTCTYSLKWRELSMDNSCHHWGEFCEHRFQKYIELYPQNQTTLGKSLVAQPHPNDPAPSHWDTPQTEQICALEAHTTQTNTVTAKDEALRTLSLTRFKCSSKTRSLPILGTAGERCGKESCQSVQRSSRRWREKREKTDYKRGREGKGAKKRNNNPKWDYS